MLIDCPPMARNERRLLIGRTSAESEAGRQAVGDADFRVARTSVLLRNF
jgi:hypothetical protein